MRCCALCIVLLLLRRVFGVRSSKFAHRGRHATVISSSNPNLNPHLNRIFDFSIAFSLRVSIFQSRFPIAFLNAILLYSPFRLAIACKSHLTFESFTSYLTKPLSLTTALLLLAKYPDTAGDFADK